MLSAVGRAALVLGVAVATAAVVMSSGGSGRGDIPATAPRAPSHTSERPARSGRAVVARPASEPARRPTGTKASAASDPEPTVRPSPPEYTTGDLIVSGIDGTSASRRLLGEVRDGGVAGVLLLGANIATVAQVRALTGSLQAAANAGGQPPLLIMVDQEGGTVRRFGSAHPARSARGLSAIPVAAVRAEGRAAGADLVERGVNVDLAPVVDVEHSATNFLGTRAFGSDPGTVARYACAFADGVRAGGALPTFKHFPGLGWAGATNTDVAPVTIAVGASALQDDWAAYSRCAAHGPALTMVSNAIYPALSGTRPAVVAPATYRAIRSLGFTGAVITDSLEAGSVHGIEHLAARAVHAGADLLLYTSEDGAARAAAELRAAARAGRLAHATVLERGRRVRALRYCAARTRSRAAANSCATSGSM